ncbi:MAG: NAD(P)H-hydrate dehydratase [Candidatus Diapherotrites archaeon]
MNLLLSTKILDCNAQFYGYPVEQLMDNAGKGIAREIEKRFGSGKSIAIFCGLGNNGGDGFVAARYLSGKNRVTVFLAGKPSEIKTIEARSNWERLKKIKKVKKIVLINAADSPKAVKADLVVEALFGVGVKGKLKEPFNSIIKRINSLRAKKIAVDAPAPGFNADLVISLHEKKVQGAVVVGIGIPKELESIAGPGYVKFLAQRKAGSHKGENGKVLIVAGSKKWHGAALFSGITASRLVDLVFFATEKENVSVVKKFSPEFIVSELKEAEKIAKGADAVLVGPGLPLDKKTKKTVNGLLKKFGASKKFVLDASALHLLDKKLLTKNCCLTPHAGEFKVLFGVAATEANVKAMAKKFGCAILLKGEVDLVSDGKRVYRNFSGNAMMTSGGTGDVLAGLLVGFAAKNDLLHSALAAAFLNGFAGDLLLEEKGEMFNADDLMDKLSEAKKFCLELC